jgi:hypothetical protein
MATIYLSSTYSDLIEYRNTVYRALRRMRHNVIAMEDYVAADERPLDRCLADVVASDLYIDIFAWRYGFIPKEANPEHKSITELEYRKAVETGKFPLIFLLDPKALWPPTTMDMFTGEGNSGKAILALCEELGLQTLVSFFHNAEELAGKVSQAVSNWEREHTGGKQTLMQALSQSKYLENVCERYSTAKLPIGPAEGFFLNAIFHKLHNVADKAREDLPGGALRQTRQDLLKQATAIYEAATATQARQHLDGFVRQWQEQAPKAVSTLQRDFETTIAYYQLPEVAHQLVHSTSLLERANRELRRKFRQVCCFSSRQGALAVIFLQVQRFNARWSKQTWASTAQALSFSSALLDP